MPFLEAAVVSVPHPLAQRLIERLQARSGALVLDFATGSGRNARALAEAGFAVVCVSDAEAASDDPLRGVQGPFAATLSTHGLLHGTAEAIQSRLTTIAERLDRGGLLYASLGSSADARFGQGRRIDERTFAPLDGDERGVPHAFFDEHALRALLEADFTLESLEHRAVDDVAGSWAHRERPLRGAAHWFVTACKR